ncbi:guanine nucleotide exchange factor MSS4 [Spea bombifrons]|uniref:guanine nucleotide exchange factor MSS4 n=1 Tax=Spea bombifrons TaxID=233779 RepID=UPI002349DB1C|nr:guanine nucleotide exchange factor MSS4 [Spea bombifrons]
MEQSLLSEDGRNARAVVCQRCRCRVLSAGVATLARKEVLLPLMRMKTLVAEASAPECEVLVEHWLVHDMFTFENVGFSKDVGSVKYLVCADCEVGPIGWHSLEERNSFYVALERVQHE